MLRHLVGSPREEIPSIVRGAALDAAIDDAAIRRQLARMIGSPLFSQSRRYSSLLRYLVEESLNGNSGRLKERTVGVDVFGREPSYDTNSDPVVRTTAAQLRHRIAQYYAQPGREFELRIALPSGAYVPEFLSPGRERENGRGAGETIVPQTLEPESTALEGPPIGQIPSLATRWLSTYLVRWRPIAIGLIAVTLICVSIGLGIGQSARTDAALRKFWDPVWDESGTVLLCIGEQARRPSANNASPSGSPPGGITVRESLSANSVAWPDAVVLAQLAGLARASGQAVRLRKSSLIEFTELRDSPDVLVGGFNNQWIMRLGKNLRFRYVADPDRDAHWIQDQWNPDRRDWQSHMNGPYSGFLSDYGLITRVLDASTEKTVVIASGIAAYGTMAAGEFLTSEKYMKMVVDRAPKGWERKNLQVVISTEVIGGNAGPPRILAMHVW